MTERAAWRAAHVVVGTTLLVALAAACDSDSTAEPTASPEGTVSPSLSADQAVEQARTAVKEVYDRYRRAHVVAAATSDYNSPDLPKYVADPLLTQLRLDLRQKERQGLITTGQPSWDARVTAVNVSTRPFTATIEDCFDGTGWNTVDRRTGKSAAVPGQAKKFIVIAEAAQYDDGRWLIRSSKPERERPC